MNAFKDSNVLDSCDDVLVQDTNFPLTRSGNEDIPILPVGTKVGLRTTLKNAQCVECTNGSLSISKCDIFGVFILDHDFNDIKPTVSLILSTHT